MNIYSKKRKWKIALATIACSIVALSLWYSNRLVHKIKMEERNKIALWSAAIQNRARLVSYTEALFNSIQEEEDLKIKTWAKATKLYIQSESSQDREFYNSIITNNTTIPIIQTDKKDQILSWNNIDAVQKRFYSELDSNEINILQKELQLMKKHARPIRITYFENQYNLLHYRESKIAQDLKLVFDEFIHAFISETVLNSAQVPVLLVDSTQTEIIASGNIDSTRINPENIAATLAEMREENEPIKVELGNGNLNYIYFEDSLILKELGFYPVAQLFTLGLFLFFAYILFSSFRNEEQNQVWVGMAKETAHQLGTPLSSLMAWIEVLKTEKQNEPFIGEFGKDVKRLELITDRFSKIGSLPDLVPENLQEFLNETIDYLRPRLSTKVEIHKIFPEQPITVKISKSLLSWVLENILKNGVDAMDGEGKLRVEVMDKPKSVMIDISDTGKGISLRKQKTVFNPGYTTKARGWGLGLSLARRIVEIYHNGRIFVKTSEIGVGTTFRIILRK